MRTRAASRLIRALVLLTASCRSSRALSTTGCRNRRSATFQTVESLLALMRAFRSARTVRKSSMS